MFRYAATGCYRLLGGCLAAEAAPSLEGTWAGMNGSNIMQAWGKRGARQLFRLWEEARAAAAQLPRVTDWVAQRALASDGTWRWYGH